MSDTREAVRLRGRGALIYKQTLTTRLTHWVWAISLFFLLLTGLQIFNAHPALYIGRQSGFGFDNAVLKIGTEEAASGPVGVTTVFGKKFVTTGLLGLHGAGDNADTEAFPGWATIPSYHDLGTGRVIHFFFAWILVGTLIVWLLSSLINGHLRRDVLPRVNDVRNIGRDIADHARLRFHHTRDYSVLQKLSYAGVLFVVFPLIVLSGLSMSPGVNSLAPWLVELLGGRQTARTIHFTMMLLLLLFFVVHILMVIAAGPLNELRSIVTGWYRADPETSQLTRQAGE